METSRVRITLKQLESELELALSIGDFSQAAELCNRILAQLDTRADTRVALFLERLGDIRNSQNDTKGAEDTFIKAMHAIAAVPDSALRLASIQNKLAGFYYANFHYRQAEAMCLSSLTGFAAALGQNDPETLQVRINLARIYFAQDKFDLADRECTEVIATALESFAPDHPTIQSFVAVYVGMFEPLFSSELMKEKVTELYAECERRMATKMQCAQSEESSNERTEAGPRLPQIRSFDSKPKKKKK